MIELIWQIRDYLQQRKFSAIADGADDDHEQCVGCDSTDTKELAPRAYHCNQCGYEGGEGYAAYQKQQDAKHYETLPVLERTRSALADLKEARTLLLNAQGYMQGALSESRWDMMGIGGGGNNSAFDAGSKYDDIEQSSRFRAEASACLSRASLKLGKSMPKVDVGGISAGAEFWDTAMDGLIADLNVHSKLKSQATDIDNSMAAIEMQIRKTQVLLERLQEA